MAGHVVWEYSLRAGRQFFPGGHKVRIGYFQDYLRRNQSKINVSLKVINDYGLGPKVKLGRALVSQVNPLASYLYNNAIHPRFFADALNVIANKARELDPGLDHVQLRNLGRANLEKAIKKGTVKPEDLGVNFKAFCRQDIHRKIQLLISLGVIVLTSGSTQSQESQALPARPERDGS